MIATAIDVILALVVIEAVGLCLFHQLTGSGVPPKQILGTLAAGFCLMLALRLALGGAGEASIAACLLGSLVAHLGDLALRWSDARRT